MAGKIVFPLFWGLGALLVVLTARTGGWALVVPAAVAVTATVFALDLVRHREIVTFDQDLARTAAHVLSAAAIAASCMYWLGLVLLGS